MYLPSFCIIVSICFSIITLRCVLICFFSFGTANHLQQARPLMFSTDSTALTFRPFRDPLIPGHSSHPKTTSDFCENPPPMLLFTKLPQRNGILLRLQEKYISVFLIHIFVYCCILLITSAKAKKRVTLTVTFTIQRCSLF